MNQVKGRFGELIQAVNQSWLNKLFARGGNEACLALDIRLERCHQGTVSYSSRVQEMTF
jgi:hypothetical protein